jgi:dienelactone hydrolase
MLSMKLLRTFALVLCLFGVLGSARAQTAWPGYMPLLTAGASDSPTEAKLLTDVVIVTPDTALPQALVRWSGIWQGWGCLERRCDVKLAVEQVSATEARIVYAASTGPQSSFVERVTATLIGEEIHSKLRTGSQLILRLRADGDMEYTLWRNNTNLLAAGVLTQQKIARKYIRTVERVATPWSENNKPITLEMVRYQPLGPGPFPTAVMNHGSTGEGDRPAFFSLTWTSIDIVDYFIAKGWQVVFPQRRGRGSSGGLYDEGFELNRSRYTCEAKLSLPGLEHALVDLDAVFADLRARPEVDAKRILIGGVSRGGILSVVYAGTRPAPLLGVVNFVGGWVGDDCQTAEMVNTVSFTRGATFARPMLWLYGENDSFYTLAHSRKNFATFEAAGGKASFQSIELPKGQDGHSIHVNPKIWAPYIDAYFKQLEIF